MEQSFKRISAFGQRCPLIFSLPSAERECTGKDMYSLGRDSGMIVLPMYAYHVLMTMPVDYDLNLFQSTILRLLGIRNHTDNELAELLCIKQSLAEYIIRQLTENGYISCRQPTDKGRKYLSSDRTETECRTGYVLYDTVCGDFLDSFIPEKEFTALDYECSVWRVSGAGTDTPQAAGGNATANGPSPTRRLFKIPYRKSVAKKEIYLNALLVLPESEPEMPILSVKRCEQICRSAYIRMVNDEAQKEDIDIESRLKDIRNECVTVKVLPDPQAVYVGTVVYLKGSGVQWRASSPLEWGDYPNLTDELSQRYNSGSDSELCSLINRMCETRGLAVNNSAADLGKKAEISRLHDVFRGNDIPESVIDSLADAAFSFRILESDSISVKNVRYQSRLGEYVKGCYSAVENALAKCRDDSVKRISSQKSGFGFKDYLPDGMNGSMFLASLAMSKFGFVQKDGVSFEQFFRKVHASSLKNSTSMPSLIAAGMIQSMVDSRHPFVDNDHSSFLSDMIWLKDNRDPCLHNSTVMFSFDDVCDDMEATVDYVMWLLGISGISADEVISGKRKKEDPDSHSMELDNEAALEMQKHGISIMEPTAAKIELSQCVSGFMSGDQSGFIMHSATLTELLVKHYSYELNRQVIKEYLDGNVFVSPNDMAVDLCTKLDCLPEDHENLETFFRYSKVKDLRDTRKLVCSAALFYSLVCAVKIPNGSFARFIRGRKSFISDICLIHLMRGHNGSNAAERMKEAGFTRESAEALLDRLYEYTRIIDI